MLTHLKLKLMYAPRLIASLPLATSTTYVMQAKGLSFTRQGGRHASELLVRSPMSCTNRDGKKLLEASKSWLPSRVSLGTPRLWNIFQNDLIYSVDTGLTMYADDHQIYEIGKETCTLESQLQQSASLATNWYDSNLLQGNLQKYQILKNEANAQVTSKRV